MLSEAVKLTAIIFIFQQKDLKDSQNEIIPTRGQHQKRRYVLHVSDIFKGIFRCLQVYLGIAWKIARTPLYISLTRMC